MFKYCMKKINIGCRINGFKAQEVKPASGRLAKYLGFTSSHTLQTYALVLTKTLPVLLLQVF